MKDYRQIPIVPAGGTAASLATQAAARQGAAMDRRVFLKLMAASAALASGACSGPPEEKIVPYVQMPELQVPGQPVFYATAFMRRGLAHGVLLENNMGRPTKVEGNPRHPASLGSTDAFMQASILQFWDPDRSQTVYRGQAVSTWQALASALQEQRSEWDADGGAGLRILTGSVSSPALAAQLNALLKTYPRARWHAFDPLHDDAGMLASQLAFGRPADILHRFDRAELIVAADADVAGDWPGAIPHARAIVRDRRAHGGGNAPEFARRLFAIEATPTLTGAMADNRLALAPQQTERLLWRVAARLGVPGIPGDLFPALEGEAGRWEAVLAKRLGERRGRSAVVAGGALSPQTRALAHLINAHLGNLGVTVMPVTPVDASPVSHVESIAALCAEMRRGLVKSLFILGANPAYDAPADLDFARGMARVPFSVHLGLYRDETARQALWHVPQAHDYEQWGDGRAFDGTASIVQPVIAPLYGGRSPHELLALMMRDDERTAYGMVRRYWQQRAGADFESFWQTALRQGVVPDSAAAPLAVRAAQSLPPPRIQDVALQPLFIADAAAGAGEFANNAWLQELPRPLSGLTWDNAALFGPATAARLKVADGDVVQLSLANASMKVEAPARILPGQAEGTVALPLGYGRRAAGRVGDGVGFNAYRLRTRDAMRGAAELAVDKTGMRHDFAVRQGSFDMQARDIVRMASLEEFRRTPEFAHDQKKERQPQDTLYPQWTYAEYKWGMAIDLNACIGCNACTIACQAENNIPVVGREQVQRGREMHWIRVDRYEVERNESGHKQTGQKESGRHETDRHEPGRGESAQAAVGAGRQRRTVFQPVPCMHCENAPCEEVCPVGATMHDSEGLNVQVYNRCVGTRFCSNNCPYKVRRFNFLQFSNTSVESLKALQNPEVTVRRRGVMEKCTYCLQRISRARHEAEIRGQRIQDGEVVTACQAACPTEAIVFGDLNDPGSRVNQAKRSPLDYALLAELHTQPRTTYAARVINPDPELE